MSDFINKAKVFLGFESAGVYEENVKRQNTVSSNRASLIKFNSGKSNGQSEIRVIEPRVYEDCLTISSFLRQGVASIVNLKYIDGQNGKRLIDFLCGTAYAIGGHMSKLGENIFLFSPENISIIEGNEKISNYEEEQENTNLLNVNFG